MDNRFWSATAAMLLCTPAIAHAKLDLQLPVDCVIGETCFIQNYMDHNPAPDASHDYMCGSLTYDGHNGTDFRVLSYADLEAGVNVLAAAAGEVSYIRVQQEIEQDDIPLLQLIKLGMYSNCGSTIRINHGTGWESIYCHMDADGFAVKEGEKVKAGQVIGRMGTSGKTQFPHVHYELQHYANPIDPFVGYAGPYDCSSGKLYSQWNARVADQLFYIPTGVVSAGFSSQIPIAQQVRAGGFYNMKLHAAESTIYFGIELYGIRPYDVLTIRVFAPDGRQLAEKEVVYDTSYALAFETVSAEKEGEAAWPKGRYSAHVTLGRFENIIKETIIDRYWRVDMVEK